MPLIVAFVNKYQKPRDQEYLFDSTDIHSKTIPYSQLKFHEHGCFEEEWEAFNSKHGR